MTPTNAVRSIDETIEFGYGTLVIAEAADGAYQPVAMVSTMAEARLFARENFQHRAAALDKGETPMCPERYVVWGNGAEGYRILSTIEL